MINVTVSYSTMKLHSLKIIKLTGKLPTFEVFRKTSKKPLVTRKEDRLLAYHLIEQYTSAELLNFNY